jgi:hypothetical protein
MMDQLQSIMLGGEEQGQQLLPLQRDCAPASASPFQWVAHTYAERVIGEPGIDDSQARGHDTTQRKFVRLEESW